MLLISSIPAQDGNSAMFHVREIGGKTSTFNLTNNLTGAGLKCAQVDVTGTPLSGGTTTLKPFESKFFKVEF